MECFAQSLKSATHGGLTEQQAIGGPGDVPLVGQNSEDHEKVEISLS